VYDEETGYCQGLSFLAAALLLHVRTSFAEFHNFYSLLQFTGRNADC